MKQNRKLVVKIAALFAVSVFVVAGCGGDGDNGNGPETAAEEAGAPDSEIVIGYASPVATQPNQVDIATGMEDAAASLGWGFEVLDSDLAPDRQVSNIDTMITTDTNGIISWTLDPGALDAAYERAAGEGIPLVGMNSEGEYLNTVVWWEVYDCSDTSSKQRTMDFILEHKGEGARVLVVGPPPIPTLVDGMQCFIDRAEQAGLEVVGREDNVEDQSATATPLVEDMLSQHGEVDVVWSYNDSSAIGASAAIDNQGLGIWTTEETDGVIVVGNNGDADAISAIAAGRLTMTWDALPAESGAAAIRALAPVLRDGEDVSAMPSEIRLDTEQITIENVDEYIPPSEREIDIDDLPIVSEG